jgi:DHA2 family multidrug resistance protein-like MFS transporter
MSTAQNAATNLQAGRREWMGVAVLALAAVVVVMDLTVLFLAVPKLTADLHPSSTQLLWITDVYGFLIAGLLIAMGALGDRIGRRKVLSAEPPASVPPRCCPRSRSAPRC